MHPSDVHGCLPPPRRGEALPSSESSLIHAIYAHGATGELGTPVPDTQKEEVGALLRPFLNHNSVNRK